MAMKQTQTKMFDFSDIGLDFCAGSKNLFPDRFKKMFALGYNTQTVSSVSVAGNQVVLTYGVNHGYVADRVLKISASNLNGEYVIDGVTSNTVTLTIDNAPSSISGGFTTFIAPLGWQLVYEKTNVHVYKFKALDESDLYLRLCFQDQAARRNCVSPCVGKTVNLSTGFITDALSLAETRDVQTPHNGFKWEFGFWANSTYDNYNYTQGFTQYAKGLIVGSAYHLISMHTTGGGADQGRVVGFLPTFCHDYDALKFPILIGESFASLTGNGSNYQCENGRAFIGNVRVVLDQSPLNDSTLFSIPQAINSFTAQDTFNTTTAAQIYLYEQSTRQQLGVVNGGLYVCKYATTNYPATNNTSPTITKTTDMDSICPIHYMSASTANTAYVFLTAPLEEIKIA